MKRRVALIGLLLSMMACGPALAEQAQGMLLVVTGAYYSPEGRVMVTGKPARVELPQGAQGDEYILVEEAEQAFALNGDAYIAVPADAPDGDVQILQSSAADFPIYLTEYLALMDSLAPAQQPPDKGDGISYREYGRLYRAAVQQGVISFMTFCPLPEGFAP